MHETYDYAVLRAADGEAAAPAAADGVRTAGAGLAGRGGTLMGVWEGARGIGFDSDEVVVLVGWAGEPGAADDVLSPDGSSAALSARLRATVRPVAPVAFEPGGVVAHRWFVLRDAADADEFVALSDEAWTGFESAYDTQPLGLWHDGGVRLLLMTRYASVAEWERSRGTRTAASGPAAEAGRRFARRRELLQRSGVRLAPFPVE